MTNQHQVFGSDDPEQEKQYSREARLQYDQEIVRESHQNWNSYTKSQQEFIKEEGNQIYQAIAAQLAEGKSANDADVQVNFERWHEHLHYFYEPTLDLLAGLGQLYNSSPDFMANFQKLHPQLPAFLEAGISHYVDALETAMLEDMLAEDEDDVARQKRLSK